MADLRAARAAGVAAVGALSTLTAQSSARVMSVRTVPRGWLRAQLEALETECAFGAVKTGLLAAAPVVREFCDWYRGASAGPLVVDPVIEAGDGTRLLSLAAERAVAGELLLLAALVTPNRAEAEALSGEPISDRASAETAARRIADRGPAAVLIKGGHLPGPPADLLWDGSVTRWISSRVRLPGRWRGLGCHLAAAIAARLAAGDPLRLAVSRARRCLVDGMKRGKTSPSGRRIPDWGSRSST